MRKSDKRNSLRVFVLMVLRVSLVSVLFIGCGGAEEQGNTSGDGFYKGTGVGGETVRILSGSENKVLSDILEQCARETGVSIEMTYMGSVDII